MLGAVVGILLALSIDLPNPIIYLAPGPPTHKFPQNIRDVGSFLGILIPALLREGPHLGSELSVGWLIWSRVLREQENHLLVAVRIKRMLPRKYLKMLRGLRIEREQGRKMVPLSRPSPASTHRTSL